MFRRGGSTSSAGTGITSGLQAPRQGYEGTGNASDQNVQKDLRDMSIEEIQAYTESLNKPKPRNNKDLFIDFGLDLISRPGSGGSIFQNIGASGQKAYNQYRTANTAADSKIDDRRADMFTELIKSQGEVKSGKTYNNLATVERLANNIMETMAINDRIAAGTETPKDLARQKILQMEENQLSKKDSTTEALITMFTNSNPYYLGEKADSLMLDDKKLPKEQRKYEGPGGKEKAYADASVYVRKIFESYKKQYRTGEAEGGRIGYANGEMVKEQVTETMDVGPMGQPDQADNPISYDQLRARLPQEISDDIVQLMSNSAEALEDFAMISTQQDVDQFNKKFSVNLVLPAEA
jgi:hypothetical protein